MSFGRDSESALLRAACDLLTLRGVFHWRASNHGVARADRRTGRVFYTFAGMKGVSDILGIVPREVEVDGRVVFFGVLLAVEVKRPGGRLTSDQQSFLDRIRESGGIAVCISDIRELERLLDEL